MAKLDTQVLPPLPLTTGVVLPGMVVTCRSSPTRRDERARPPTPPVSTIDAVDVRRLLGRPRFFFEAAEATSVPGVATGPAVTGTGGDVLFIEATRLDGTASERIVVTANNQVLTTADLATFALDTVRDDWPAHVVGVSNRPRPG